jgi:integrase
LLPKGASVLPKRALTDAAVRRLKPPSKGQVDHFDQGYPGLALRISYGGRRTWVFFNRWDGKLHRARLGTYPAMSLAEAREAWREAREKADKGIDPSFRKPKGASSTIDGVADEFLKRHVANLKPRTIEEYTRPIEKLIKPRWGHRAPKEITRADILTLLDDVAEKSGPIAANRTLSLVRKFWNWAVERGIVESNPGDRVKPYAKERSRDRVLSDDELAQLWPAFDEMGYPFGAFMKILLLTAQRRQEVATMQWCDIDLGTQPPTWTVPRSVTKGDREHTVQLSEQVIAILTEIPKFEGNDYVFTSKPGRPVSGFSKAKVIADRRVLEARQKSAEETGQDPKAATPLPAWRIHDLRRTAASNMARMGIPPHVVAAVLNHSPGSTQGITAIYNRYRYSDEKRDALYRWARHIESLLNSPPANVVDLQGFAD